MTDIEISTAARRIAREVNSTSPDLTIRFDSDGSVLRVDPKGMWAAEGPDSYFVKFNGTKGTTKLSQASAQAQLDAMTRALLATGGDFFASRDLAAEELATSEFGE